jgi:hypothetical protein
MKWSDNGGDIYTVFTRDELLTHATIYWTGNAIASSDECIASFLASDRAPWYNHISITAHPRGGHFIPWEIPEEWTADLVGTFRSRPDGNDPGPRHAR